MGHSVRPRGKRLVVELQGLKQHVGPLAVHSGSAKCAMKASARAAREHRRLRSI
jgi:hypothetical protein